jgi:hypothetical protein
VATKPSLSGIAPDRINHSRSRSQYCCDGYEPKAGPLGVTERAFPGQNKGSDELVPVCLTKNLEGHL